MRIVRMSFRSPRYNNTAVSQVTSSQTQGGILKCQFRQSWRKTVKALSSYKRSSTAEFQKHLKSMLLDLYNRGQKSGGKISFVALLYTTHAHPPPPTSNTTLETSIHSFSWLSTLGTKQQRFWATDVNLKWTFCIIGQWFCWTSWVNRLYKRRET